MKPAEPIYTMQLPQCGLGGPHDFRYASLSLTTDKDQPLMFVALCFNCRDMVEVPCLRTARAVESA